MFTRRRLFLVFLGVLLAGVAAAGWYVCTKGFTRRWRTFIVAEFQKKGIEVSIHRLTLDPFRGLVASEVRLFDARDRRRVLAVVDEMLLSVNYAGAFRGTNFVDTADLRQARLSLPLDSANPDGAKLDITGLNARLFFAHHQIYLARAEADVFGIKTYASGRLINPEAYTGAENAGHGVARLSALVEQLRGLHYPDAPPVLSLQFRGDLARPEEISVDARLYAEKVTRRSYTMQQFLAVASFRNGVLELQQVSARDERGELRASGRYDSRDGRVSIHAQSGLSVPELMRAFALARWPSNLVVSTAPQLDLQVEGALPDRRSWRVSGHVALDRFTYQGVVFKGLGCDFSWQRGRWSVREAELRHRSGDVHGDAMRLPGDFRADLHGSINPRVFVPVLQQALGDWVQRFEFVDPPEVTLHVRGTAATLQACTAEGQIGFKRSTYEGVPTEPFSAAIRYADRTVSLWPFPRPPEEAPQEMIFNLDERVVHFRNHEPAPAASAPLAHDQP